MTRKLLLAFVLAFVAFPAASKAPAHPILEVLDQYYGDAPEFFVWDNLREKNLTVVARSTQAAVPGALDALWTACRGDGAIYACGVIWVINRDPQVVPFIHKAFDERRYEYHRDELAFVLAAIKDPRSIPILARRLKQASDPYLRIAYARALYKIDADAGALSVLKTLSRDDPKYRDSESPPSAYAARALEDVGLGR